MRESCTYGSVRGARGNSRPYRDRREFITLLGGAAVGWPLAVHAQASKNVPRLCFLTFDPPTSRSTRFDAFFQGLIDLGYVDEPSPSTTFPRTVMVSGFRASLLNVCVSRRTSSP